MKICFLSMEYLPSPPYMHLGGVGTHTYHLSNSLARLGHEVHVIVSSPNNKCRVTRGIKIHGVPLVKVKGGRVLIYSLLASRKLRNLSRTVKFDIVHNQSPYGFFVAYVHVLERKIPLVTTVHAIPTRQSEYYSYSPLRFYAIKTLCNKLEYRESTKIIAISNCVKNALVQCGVPKRKISVVPNGVDTKKFSPKVDGNEIRKKLKLKNSAMVLLFVGGLDRSKGARLLMKSIPRINKECSDVHWVIVGSGHLPENIKKVANESNQITIVGRIPHEILPSYYAVADLVVLPSLIEGGPPLTLLEAMSSAKPVLTTDIPSILELIRDDSVVFTSPCVEKLTKETVDLLQDGERRRMLAIKARSCVMKHFTWEKVAEKTERVYKSAIAES